MSDKKKAVSIFTDGGCRGNPGPGAWAAILRYKAGEKEISGYQADTTNNRMELTAAICALEELNQPCLVEFFTDSEYLRRGITEWIADWKRRGWRTSSKKPVKNQDLWQRLDELADGHEVDWKWVRGHSGHAENERCDELVNEVLDRNGA